MAGSDMRFRVGYALQPEKVGSVVQPSLITHSKKRGIDLIQVDLCKPLVDQGPFHCLVHKLYTPDWNRQLTDFQSTYPDAIVIDSPSSIEPLHNRAYMLDVIDDLCMPQFDSQTCIGIPRQVVASDTNSLFSDNSRNLNFPVIAKPLLANGNDLCHEMCLVFDSSALDKVKPPVILQEFVNHGGVLLKVYVAGDHVKCVKRTSLPDITEKMEGGFIPFSQISSFDVPDHQQHGEPPLEFIHNIAKALREATKLHLFNFDMIRDTKAANTKYLIIDINYFPGFAKVTGFENMLTDFFWDIVTRSQMNFITDLDTTEKEGVPEVTQVLDVAKHDDLTPVIDDLEPKSV